MLLPDNIHPELSIYYNGSLILNELKKTSHQTIMDLYYTIREENGMSFSIFVLSLDWLYLIDAAQITEEGIAKKCF